MAGWNIELGVCGEDAAAQFLTSSGVDVVERNWRCRYGELDLIARDGDTMVFVEVKTRSGDAFGTPAEAVTPAKQRRIHRLAGLYLVERKGPWVPTRFDVIEVIVRRGADPVITHLPAVF